MLRILIVDDHLIVRQGLKQFVESASENVMAAETCSGQEAIKLVQRNAHDVVLMGITLSTIDPIELLKQIRADKPKLPVLILSVLDEEQYCGRLLRAGASGILTKESVTSELVDAVTKVYRGGKYVSPSLAERLTDFPADRSTSLPDALSDREYEVMVSMASGKRIKQIADEMSLSIKTVTVRYPVSCSEVAGGSPCITELGVVETYVHILVTACEFRAEDKSQVTHIITGGNRADNRGGVRIRVYKLEVPAILITVEIGVVVIHIVALPDFCAAVMPDGCKSFLGIGICKVNAVE